MRISCVVFVVGFWRNVRANCPTYILSLLVGVVCFLAFASVLLLAGVTDKKLDLALYATGVTIIPVVAAVVCLPAWGTSRQIGRSSDRTTRARYWPLVLALMSLPILFFDYSLAVDPFPYLTNIGPAVHLLNGGTLLVDTFSQYGPGPVLLTFVGFVIGPVSFGTANVTVQIINLFYYSLFIVYIYRVSKGRTLALLLGLLSIAFLMVAWGHGESNLNASPSPLMRYFPTLMMVVAIAFLQTPARHSVLTATATAFSAIWSVDTLFGTLAVHMAFLAAMILQTREWSRIPKDILLALSPAVLAVAALSMLIAWKAGELPHFGVYLDFIHAYNPLSDFFAIPRQPFYWWVPMLASAFLVLTYIWMNIIRGGDSAGAAALLYRGLPMTVLLVWAGLYYAIRSADIALLKAFLPFAALAITIGLDLLESRLRLVVVTTGLIAVCYLFYDVAGILQPKGAYSFYLQECRDHGRCTITQLRDRLINRLNARPAAEPLGNPWSDFRLHDRGVLTDAMNLIDQYATKSAAVTVLLGRAQNITFLSDMALLYTGHWHRWPISFTFTDNLSPSLVRQILATPVSLKEGEVVVARRDETTLEGIEKEIMSRVRSDYCLSEIPGVSLQVVAYRVSAGKCSE
jgi:hypothetical protein